MRNAASTATTSMPTATDGDVFTNPDDEPSVRETRAAFDEALRREAEADARKRRSSMLVNPFQDDPPAELSDGRLEAIEHMRDVMVEAARASRERIRTEKAWRAARERARDAVRAASHQRVRELVKRLASVLDEAAAVNRELIIVEDRERTLTGDWYREGFAWPELAEKDSRLADWKRAAIERSSSIAS